MTPAPNPRQSVSDLAADEEPVGEIPDDDEVPSEPVSRATASGSSLLDSPADTKRPAEVLAAQCRVCGRPFRANEAFCGNCSMPRVAGAASDDMQSKWASLWYMQQAQDVLDDRGESPELQAVAGPLEPQARESAIWQEEEEENRTDSVWRRPERGAESTRLEQEPTRTLPLDYDAIEPRSWDDAIREAWGHAQQTIRRYMRRRNAAMTVMSLAIFLLLLVFAWWPSPTPSHLTWFESVLVELGLAQVPSRAPAAPAGNPDVRVWVDVHTALYYCPASDLYGKTPGGQFTTQHDAQQGQFEPATGVVCE
jgi:hypothetical protein